MKNICKKCGGSQFFTRTEKGINKKRILICATCKTPVEETAKAFDQPGQINVKTGGDKNV